MPETSQLIPKLKEAGTQGRKAWEEGFGGSGSAEQLGQQFSQKFTESFSRHLQSADIFRSGDFLNKLNEQVDSHLAAKLKDQLPKLYQSATKAADEYRVAALRVAEVERQGAAAAEQHKTARVTAQQEVLAITQRLTDAEAAYKASRGETNAVTAEGTAAYRQMAQESVNLAAAKQRLVVADSQIANDAHINSTTIRQAEQERHDAAERSATAQSKYNSTLNEFNTASSSAFSASSMLAGIMGGAVVAGVQLVASGFEHLVELGFHLFEEAIHGAEELAEKLVEVGEEYSHLNIQIEEYSAASGEALADLQEHAEKVFNTLDVGGQDVGKTMAQLGSMLGLEAGPALDRLTHNVEELQGRFSNLRAADLGSIFVAFQTPADQVNDALATLLTNAQGAGQGLGDLVSGMSGEAAEGLKEAGMSLGQAAHFVAELEKHGLKPAQVMTAIAQAQKQFSKDNLGFKDGMAEARKELIALGDTAAGDKLAQTLFGRRWIDAKHMIDEYNETLSKTADAYDAPASATDEFLQKTEDLGNKIEEFKHKIEGAFKPFAEGAIDAVENGLTKISAWFDEHHTEIISKIKQFGDEFIDDLPKIKEFAEIALRLAGDLAQGLVIAFTPVANQLGLAGAGMLAITGNFKEAGDLLKAVSKIDAAAFTLGIARSVNDIADKIGDIKIDTGDIKSGWDDIADRAQGFPSMKPGETSTTSSAGHKFNYWWPVGVPGLGQESGGGPMPPGSGYYGGGGTFGRGTDVGPESPGAEFWGASFGGAPGGGGQGYMNYSAADQALNSSGASVSEQMKSQIINEGRQYGLTDVEIGMILATGKHESNWSGPGYMGFGPEANAAGLNFTDNPLGAVDQFFKQFMSRRAAEGNPNDPTAVANYIWHTVHAAADPNYGSELLQVFNTHGYESGGSVAGFDRGGFPLDGPGVGNDFANETHAKAVIVGSPEWNAMTLQQQNMATWKSIVMGLGGYQTGGIPKGFSAPGPKDIINAKLAPREYVWNEHAVDRWGPFINWANWNSPHGSTGYFTSGMTPGFERGGPAFQQVIWSDTETGQDIGEDSGRWVGTPGSADPGFYHRGKNAFLDHTGHVHTTVVANPFTGEPYSEVRAGSDIRQGHAGFPDWVYQLGSQYGVVASTYPGHQEWDGVNHGIDWWPKDAAPDMQGAGYTHEDHVTLTAFATAVGESAAGDSQGAPGGMGNVQLTGYGEKGHGGGGRGGAGGGSGFNPYIGGGPGGAMSPGGFPGMPNQYGGLGIYGGETWDQQWERQKALTHANDRVADISKQIHDKEIEVARLQKELDKLNNDPELIKKGEQDQIDAKQAQLDRLNEELEKLKTRSLPEAQGDLQEEKYRQQEAAMKQPKGAERSKSGDAANEFGRNFLSGIGEALGFPDLFGKPPWDFGIWKMFSRVADPILSGELKAFQSGEPFFKTPGTESPGGGIGMPGMGSTVGGALSGLGGSLGIKIPTNIAQSPFQGGAPKIVGGPNVVATPGGGGAPITTPSANVTTAGFTHIGDVDNSVNVNHYGGNVDHASMNSYQNSWNRAQQTVSQPGTFSGH